ncbi:phosphatidylinositol mannoside acyltransferase [Williamsia sp. CHRR-6]|uniref:phosphatidylinositol mannoside acyltransferase n=1 Tax=Williamsia sp. CHRR-6 TaxID=2835871 RepID=UPI001BDA9E28|nr:phosphatidylinositol mannoside acyltransferase [Williamsia sp. CHRR-6]MBT0567969.1 phosphatidylinositol mannoside acyltransferase [Williamsia sp. CHRR-6]
MTLGQRIADWGYGLGWALVRLLPETVANRIFEFFGNWLGGRNGGPKQLRANLARVLAVPPHEVPDELMRASMRSYARYWREAFQLPSMDGDTAVARIQLDPPDFARYQEACARGKGVVFALPHSGNWDMAGVWLVAHNGTFSTVAERLQPESLFRRFVAYRESLGFEIFPLSGGEQPPFELLAERLRAGGVVCLLGERDLAKHGVPVTFFGERTRMPAGPVKLAIETGAALLAVHHHFTEGFGSQITCRDEIDVSVGLEAATQAMADVFARNIADHPADWHMLQPLWESDWSEQRRARIDGIEPTDS